MIVGYLGIMMICWAIPNQLARECITPTTEHFATRADCSAFLGEFIAGLAPGAHVVLADCIPVKRS